MTGERDAFGRDVGEDPLGAMGWSGDMTKPPRAATGTPREEAPAPAAPVTAADVPIAGGGIVQPPRPASPLALESPDDDAASSASAWVVGIVFVAVALALGVMAYGLIAGEGGDTAVRESSSTRVEIEGSVTESEVTQTSGPPRGFARGSLLLRGNLAPALRRLKARSGGGRPIMVRIAPDSVQVQVITPAERLRVMHHDWSTGTRVLATTAAPGIGGFPTLRWSQVNASAVRRMARTATSRARVPARSFAYATLTATGGTRWTIFLTDGRRYTASLDGRSVSRAP